MKTLFIDCGMGAAGDMLCSALLELIDNPEEALEQMNSFGIPHTRYIAEKVSDCGITGTHIRVEVHGEEEHEHHHGHEHHNEHHHHEHSSLDGIKHIITAANAPQNVKDAALGVFIKLAEAESTVHGTEIDHIHFHEVGSLDAVADILGFCFLLDKAGVSRIVATPVNTGKGTVKCAHGILPVPAPATAVLLKGIPAYSDGVIDGELCTPTGAAVLRSFVDEFSSMPLMKCEKTGYGMGTKKFERANCVRMMLGESEGAKDVVTELCFNVDDMTAEEIAFGAQAILESGARDVFTSPVIMKKGRPGTLVTVICDCDKKQETVSLIFTHFSTLGIRENICRRYTLERSVGEAETPLGKVRVKEAEGYGVKKRKYEYDDIAALAKENGCGLRDIINKLENGE